MNYDVILHKINECAVEIETTDDINTNIYRKYSEWVEGYRFSPQYKLHRWDGMYHAYNVKTSILPMGLIKDLIIWLKNTGTSFQLDGFRDCEFCEPLEEAEYKAQIDKNMSNAPFTLRPYQDRAVRAAIKYHRGVLLSCTGSGKSLMLFNIIKTCIDKNYKKMLLIVPNIMLVDQMYDDFKDYGWQDIDNEVERLGGRTRSRI